MCGGGGACCQFSEYEYKRQRCIQIYTARGMSVGVQLGDGTFLILTQLPSNISINSLRERQREGEREREGVGRKAQAFSAPRDAFAHRSMHILARGNRVKNSQYSSTRSRLIAQQNLTVETKTLFFLLCYFSTYKLLSHSHFFHIMYT